jgi:hypothetical protein
MRTMKSAKMRRKRKMRTLLVTINAFADLRGIASREVTTFLAVGNFYRK